MIQTIEQSWWFILLGYIAFFVFTVGIMALGAIIEKKTKIDKTICRKLTHIASAFTWIICRFFFGCSIHWIIVNAVGAVALGFVSFGRGIDAYAREDAKKSYGLFYFGVVTLVVACITYAVYHYVGVELGTKLYYAAGIAYYCLSLGDGLAPVVAKAFKNKNYELIKNRTLVGTLTVFVVSFLTVWAFTAITGIKFNLLFMISIASLTCIVEFYGIKGIDNILIDLCVFGYILLYHLNLVGGVLMVLIAVSPVLTCLLFLSKSLSFSGGLATLALFYTIGYFSVDNSMPIVFVSVMFLIATVIAIISKKVRQRRGEGEGVKHTRTGKQVLAVGVMAVVSLILYYFTQKTIFNLLYYVCITEQFADSVASDFGCLTKGKNVNIIGFKPIEKGISGGTSLLGTALALVSAFFLMGIPFALNIGGMNALCYVVASLVAFVGTLIDSILGSLFQALYKCEKCGVRVEEEYHCGQETKLIKGSKIIKNVTVNFLTSGLTFLLGFVLLFVI